MGVQVKFILNYSIASRLFCAVIMKTFLKLTILLYYIVIQFSLEEIFYCWIN